MKIETTSELANILGFKLKFLTYHAYSNPNKYNHFYIQHFTKSRKISEPCEVLKKIQSKLIVVLKEFYEVPEYVYGIDEKDYILNAQMHLDSGNKNFILMDIKDFFPSIKPKNVYWTLRNKGVSNEKKVLALLTNLIATDEGLPQGSPCSPILSNMFFEQYDKKIYLKCMQNKAIYSRYFDDLSFSFNSSQVNLERVLGISRGRSIRVPVMNVDGFLGAMLLKDQLEINSKKFSILNKNNNGVYINGIKINDKLNLSRKYIRELRSEIFNSKNLSKDDYLSKKSSILGKVHYVGRVKGKDNATYIKLLERYKETNKLHRNLI